MPAAMREGGRLVVIGGVAAGLTAASRARRLRRDIEIVVLEKGHDVSYAACSLPYYISGVIEKRKSLIVYEADFFRRERGIDLRLGARATRVSPRARTVDCGYEDGSEETLSYDALVLATGATPIVPPFPGSGMPGVFTLRTFAEGDAIKEFIDSRNPRSAVVVGAGYIGLEMAEALVTRGLEVTVVERLPGVMNTFDPDMAEIVERELHSNGVRVLTGAGVEAFEPGDDSAAVAYALIDGRRTATDMAILSVGVRPRTELAQEAGLELGASGAIKVDARQITSEASILAAGDCCDTVLTVTGKRTWIPLGTTANRQGKVAGENAVGGTARFPGVAGTNISKVFKLEVAQTGLTEKAAREEGLRAASATITASSRAHGYPSAVPIRVKIVFEKGTAKLLGAQIIGEEGAAKRIDSVAAGLRSGMTVGELSTVDMGYAPPFSPVWDPVLIAARQAVKKTGA
ncbi:MAG: NADH oxidase [Candidatus Eisenbacteria bacterium]|nr:NADH oxidase [Candidatus Eisenbacteria bacterium]